MKGRGRNGRAPIIWSVGRAPASSGPPARTRPCRDGRPAWRNTIFPPARAAALGLRFGKGAVNLGIGDGDRGAEFGPHHIAPDDPGLDKGAEGLRVYPVLPQRLDELFGAQIGAGGKFGHPRHHRLIGGSDAQAFGSLQAQFQH